MRTEQLTFFLEVVKTGSINKAAENLYVTQPGLSDSIKKMESELGLTLLNRSKTGVTLTENGRIVARHAVNILSAYNRMLNELKLLSDDELDNPKETLTIATSPLFAASILIDVIKTFRQQYPNVQITYLEASGNEAINKTQNGKCDIGFFSTYSSDAQVPFERLHLLSCTHLFQDHLVVGVCNKSPLAFHKSFNHEMFKSAKQVAFQSIQAQSFPNVIALSNNIETQITFLQENHDAITIVPQYAYNRCFADHKGLVARPIEPRISVSFFMLQQKEMADSPKIKAFIQCLEKHLLTLPLRGVPQLISDNEIDDGDYFNTFVLD